MACRICGSEDKGERCVAREMMFGMGDAYPYFVCGECGTLQIEEVPRDLARYYPDEYYSLTAPAKEAAPARLAKYLRNRYEVFGRGLIGRWLDRRNPNIYMRALRLPGIRKSWRILDVGCGSGYNTAYLGDLGFRDVTGVDPFIERDIRYLNGVHIRKATIHQLQGHWDVIFFHHSFEHVPDPEKTLRSAARLLADGGYVVIALPVVPNAAWERYGVNWVALDAPRHLFIPTRKAMDILAERAVLFVERVEYNGNDYQFWASEQFQAGIPLCSERSYLQHPERSDFTKEQIRAFRREAERLNAQGRGDQAVFTLRRVPDSAVPGT